MDTTPAPGRVALPVNDGRRRTVSWEDPRRTAMDVAGMSGIEALRAIEDGRIPPPPIALLMGFEPVTVEEGHVAFSLVPDEHLHNPLGTIHGGVMATLLDTVMGCAVQSLLPAGRLYTTTDLHVQFVRP